MERAQRTPYRPDAPHRDRVTPALFDGLIEDAAATGTLLDTHLPDPSTPGLDPAGMDDVLSAHRRHRHAWYTDLVGPLLLPVAGAEALCDTAGSVDHGLRIVLVADYLTTPEALRHARDVLREDGHAEVVGVQVPLAYGAPPGRAAEALLDALTLSVPARIEIGPFPGWEDAFDVIAEDGVEEVALRCASGLPHPRRPPTWTPPHLARALCHAADGALTVHLTDVSPHLVRDHALPDASGVGLLNLLCAARAALDGASVDEIERVVEETSPRPLVSWARTLGDAPAAGTRALLASTSCADVASVAAQLPDLGLLPTG